MAGTARVGTVAPASCLVSDTVNSEGAMPSATPSASTASTPRAGRRRNSTRTAGGAPSEADEEVAEVALPWVEKTSRAMAASCGAKSDAASLGEPALLTDDEDDDDDDVAEEEEEGCASLERLAESEAA